MRIARQPIAGLSSAACGRYGSTLSPPISSVRNTIGRLAGLLDRRAGRTRSARRHPGKVLRTISGISVRNSPTPSAPVVVELREVEQQPGIEQQLDRDPVAGDRRDVAQRLVIGAAPACAPRPLPSTDCWMSARGPDQHLRVVAVDDDDVARLDPARRVVRPARRPECRSARATIATCAVGEPSSSTSPLIRRRA